METNKNPQKKLSLSAQILIGMTRYAVVTAFTTGNLFVVLTVLTEGCNQLFETDDLKKEKTDAHVDVPVPISFGFRAGTRSPNIPAGLFCGMCSSGSNNNRGGEAHQSVMSSA